MAAIPEPSTYAFVAIIRASKARVKSQSSRGSAVRVFDAGILPPRVRARPWRVPGAIK